MAIVDDIKSQLPLNSTLVHLRGFVVGDISDEYIGWLNDQEVVKFSNQRFITHTFETCREFFESFKHRQSVFVAIEHQLTGDVLGTLTIHCDENHNTADVGIMLGNKKYWGQGYAKQAWCLIVDLLSDFIKVRKVTAGTLSCNYPMIALMKASGMKLDGIRTSQELIEGQPMDIVYYARFINI